MSFTHKDLKELISEKILVLDGAMGTMLQQRNLTADDFGGGDLEGCNENLILTRPDVILDIHRKYFEAGSDIVETNTFGATPLVLGEYGLSDKAHEINQKAAEIAKQAAKEFSTPQKPLFVAGSIGPTTKSITVTGGVTFAELIHNFSVQIIGLMEGGADLLLIETCPPTCTFALRADTFPPRRCQGGSHDSRTVFGFKRCAYLRVSPFGHQSDGDATKLCTPR